MNGPKTCEDCGEELTEDNTSYKNNVCDDCWEAENDEDEYEEDEE